MNSKGIFYGLVGLILIISVIGLASVSSNRSQEEKEKEQAILSVKEDDNVYSRNESKVALVEYLDFQCPACASTYPMVNKIKDEYKDKIQYILRHYPLSIHRFGFEASMAAEAAGKQGKFWEMVEVLFANQRTWAASSSDQIESIFKGYAQELELDIDKFISDYNSQEVKDRVRRDMTEGTEIGVNSTPTFILNGKVISNPRNIEEFRSLIDKELLENQ